MSKKLILSLALSGLVLTATAQTTVAPAIPRDEKIEQQIETLLKKMTLDEKVGQMCELTIDLLQKRANPFAGLDPKNITVKDLQKIIMHGLPESFRRGLHRVVFNRCGRSRQIDGSRDDARLGIENFFHTCGTSGAVQPRKGKSPFYIFTFRHTF